MRRFYDLKLTVNGRSLVKAAIDEHYEIRHSKSITDDLILAMLRTLNGQTYLPEFIMLTRWEIYTLDPLIMNGKAYRLVWCLHPDENYIGVINAFRRRTKHA